MTDDVFEGLTPAEKRAKLAELEELAKWKRANKIRLFRPHPKQLEFIQATKDHAEVALRAGNRQGKTETAAYFCATALTGLYPPGFDGRRWDHPVTVWACGESAIQVRDVIQQKLVGGEPNGEKWGVDCFVPKSLIGSYITSHSAGGAIEKCLVKHVSGGWSELFFKSYEQDVTKWAGASVDILWCDEEAPPAHYDEGIARLGDRDGIAINTFTPLHGMTLILPRFLQGHADRALIAMSIDDALHLISDPKALSRHMSRFNDHNAQARIYGEPLLGDRSAFDGIDLRSCIDPVHFVGNKVFHRTIGELETSNWVFFWCVDFGIGHPFGALLIGWDRENGGDIGLFYVLAEIRIAGQPVAVHASLMKAIAGTELKVLWPHDGNNRDRGSAAPTSELYRAEGLRMHHEHAYFRNKDGTRSISTDGGIELLRKLLQEGKLRFAYNVPKVIEEMQNLHYQDEKLVKLQDDLASALRIGMMGAWQAGGSGGRPGGTIADRRREQERLNSDEEIRRRIDFDLWNVT